MREIHRKNNQIDIYIYMIYVCNFHKKLEILNTSNGLLSLIDISLHHQPAFIFVASRIFCAKELPYEFALQKHPTSGLAWIRWDVMVSTEWIHANRWAVYDQGFGIHPKRLIPGFVP